MIGVNTARQLLIDMQLFELFVGQPPFDTFLLTPPILIGQMCEMASDDLPKKWQSTLDTMNEGSSDKDTELNLQKWLEEVYFGGSYNPDLTRDDISKLGLIIGKLLYFEPSARVSARQILDDPWFQE
jgi:serine/threonine protein kinase